ncbi:MAG: SDR family oxidoreductase [Gloeotrichia echinulata GP01]
MTEHTILITGCNRRLGYLLSCHFLARGFSVLAHYRTPSAETEWLQNQGAILLQADFSYPEQIISLIEKVKFQTDKLRAIVHNASTFCLNETTIEAMLNQYDALYHVHMVAPALINTELKAHLERGAQPYADIIHITDIYVNRPDPNFSLYCSTKAGLENLSLSFAKSFAPKIKVNTIQPGLAKFLSTHDEVQKEQTLSQIPLGREGGFEPIIETVDYLLSNQYVTGSVIKVDGGFSLD